MPQHKRRKLSLEEQDGKDVEKNRSALVSSDGAVGKHAGNDAGSGKEGSSSQCERRVPKSERKTETTAFSSVSSLPATGDDGRDGTIASSAGDATSKVSSSGRVIKQTKKGRCFTAAREAAQNKQTTSTTQGSGSGSAHTHSKPTVSKANTPVRGKRGRKRRNWDCWSKFEQDVFFEGLFEHGKDFDAIHTLLVYRSKKRGIEQSLIKTKEQVRHLYYRMWQKISKHVHMGDSVKKETQEIYGLVNYYSIRKIFNRLDERAVEHLNELIHKGFSKVRDPNISGKKNNRRKVRILRTPVCNALKKLNNIEESKEEFVTELPQQVTVELTPRCSAAWLKVHNLSQNPRVRFQVSVNRSVAALMEHLQKKWIGPTDRARGSLGGDETEVDELVVYPHHQYMLAPVSLAPQRATSVDLVTFSSYKNNILDSPHRARNLAKKTSIEELKNSENSSECDGHGALENFRNMKSSVKTSLLPKLTESVAPVSLSTCEDENAMFPDASFFSSHSKDSVETKVETASLADSTTTGDEATITLSYCEDVDQKAHESSPETSPTSKDKHKDCREVERETDMLKLVESATKGFTAETCRLVTLAQLSLMLDKTSHLKLEYEWRPKPVAEGTAGVGMGAGIVGEVERLTNMLRRLSNLANLEYRDIMQRAKSAAGSKMSQCTLCGHSLDRSATRRRNSADVATETDPLMVEAVGGVNLAHPAKLNSNGTIVGMAAKSNFITTTKDLMPDRDGVFRVPMPVPMAVPVRGSCPQRMTTQPSFSQLIRPPESETTEPNYLLPKKRKTHRKPVMSQRTLLPKVPPGHVILVPSSLPQNMVPSLQPATTLAESQVSVMSPGAFEDVRPVGEHLDMDVGIAMSTAAATTCAVQEVDAGTPIVSVANFLREKSSDMFAGNLHMPVIVTTTSSPQKSTQQLIQNSVSPPSLSSMLDISLPASSNHTPDAGDKFLDLVVNGNTGFSDLLKSQVKEDQPVSERGSHLTLNTPQHSLSTPPGSPQRCPLKAGAETQWLSETPDLHFLSSPVKKQPLMDSGVEPDLAGPDLSLSRFLESPVKKTEPTIGCSVPISTLSVPTTSSCVISSASFIPAPPSLFGESSQDSLAARLDVETALQSVMMESSIDYSSKFEKLAQHLADNTDASQPHM
ncbi:protein cramped-like [Littorina saxatilis]|uniref:Protein cramped-like n=1 Tax=Littorina saxatilis TaxID=31220 RepID=A0AAN9B2R3_9CAEN